MIQTENDVGRRYIRCWVTYGLFPDEYLVRYESSTGLSDLLFVDRKDVLVEQQLEAHGEVEGALLVYPIKQLDNQRWLVDLPREGSKLGSRIHVGNNDFIDFSGV